MAEFSSLGDNQNIPFTGSNPADNALNLQNPDSLLSGSMRGTQSVGSGGSFIDAANNRIIIRNPTDGSTVGIGIIPGTTTNEFGFFALDSNKNLVMKIVNGIYYTYDITNNKNVMQIGKLPDSTYGMAVAKTGYNVSDGIF